MKHFTKEHKLTEVQELLKEFPNFKDLPHALHTDSNGNIISLEVDDKKIIAWLKENNFKENINS